MEYDTVNRNDSGNSGCGCDVEGRVPHPSVIADYGLLALSTLCVWLLCCTPLVDFDFWWHLKTGEMIYRQGWVPRHDWFTYTDSGRPWIDLHWGFQLLIAALYRLGGVPLVVFCKATILTVAISVGWNAAGRNLPVWLRIACWLFPAIVVSARSLERPEILSLLFLAAWIRIINGLDEKPGRIWILPLLQVVWVNCHALSVLGIAVGVCFTLDLVVGAIVNGRLGMISPSKSLLNARTAVVAGMVIGACLVNPYVVEGALFPLELYRKFSVDRQFYSAVIEFKRPIDLFVDRMRGPGGILAGLFDVYFLAELITWLLTLLSFFILIRRQKRWSLFRIVLFASFSYLAWQATRNANLFAIVSGIVICANLSDAYAGAVDWSSSRRRRSIHLGLIMMALMVCVVSDLWAMITQESKIVRLNEATSWFAHGAVRFAGQNGFPDRAFIAHNGQAAVYIYHNGPERRVFFDPRLEVASTQTYEAHARICKKIAVGDRSWEEELREEDGRLPVVILDVRYSLNVIKGMLEYSDWRLVFADAAATVFVPASIAESLNVPAIDSALIPTPPRLWDTTYFEAAKF